MGERAGVRRAHGALSVAIAPILVVTAITGSLWTIQKHWLGVGKPAKWLMKWHQGDHWFGWAAPADAQFIVSDGSGPLPDLPLTRHYRYAYFWGVLLVAILHILLGVAMMASPWSKQVAKQRTRSRWLHHIAAIIFAWPLLLTVVTGAAYRLLRMHGFPKKGPWGVKWVLHLHQGYVAWLLPVFPLAMAAAVLLMAASGTLLNPAVRTMVVSFARKMGFHRKQDRKEK
jgi:hypothetical protein